MRLPLALAIVFLAAGLDSPHAQEPSASGPVTSHQSELLHKVAGTSIFIYAANVEPCAAAAPGKVILPLGSGFVVGVTDVVATKDAWRGFKFLVTAKHVIKGQSSVILRLNKAKGDEFTCFPLPVGDRMREAPPGVDLAAMLLPEIPDTDPTVVPQSLLLDAPAMTKVNVGVGTNVFTVGYLFGYSGQKANFPVTEFGQISVVTDEKWFENPASGMAEQSYVVQMPVAPGLSGSPMFTYGMEFDTNPFRYRYLDPFVVGVVKAIRIVPLPNGAAISQGVTFVEPASNLKALMRQIADELKAAGRNVTDD